MTYGSNAAKQCTICFRTYTGWGNNAQPINDGRCCDECDGLVSMARLNRMGIGATRAFADMLSGLAQSQRRTS